MMKYKYQILAVLIILFVVSSPLVVFYHRTKSIIISEAGEEAKNIASSIATFLERDIDPYKALNNVENYEVEDFNRQYYQEMLSVFRELKLKTDVDFIYTEKFMTEETVAYILDAEPMNSDKFTGIGQADGVSKPELYAFQNGVSTATDLILDPVWGNYITGFAPIRDPVDEEMIGLVGVDFSADHILGILQRINSVLILLFVFIASTISVLVVMLINRHMKRSSEDFLTGLKNRRAFEETLRSMIRLNKQKKVCFSLLVIDIDRFKQVNDTYGHGVGDLVLKRVANLIRSNIKETELLFRYGGDEFVIILPNTTKEQASYIAKRLSDKFCNASFRIGENQIIKTFVSVGVAQYNPEASVEQFLNEAHEAMYQKKNSKEKMM